MRGEVREMRDESSVEDICWTKEGVIEAMKDRKKKKEDLVLVGETPIEDVISKRAREYRTAEDVDEKWVKYKNGDMTREEWIWAFIEYEGTPLEMENEIGYEVRTFVGDLKRKLLDYETYMEMKKEREELIASGGTVKDWLDKQMSRVRIIARHNQILTNEYVCVGSLDEPSSFIGVIDSVLHREYLYTKKHGIPWEKRWEYEEWKGEQL